MVRSWYFVLGGIHGVLHMTYRDNGRGGRYATGLFRVGDVFVFSAGMRAVISLSTFYGWGWWVVMFITKGSLALRGEFISWGGLVRV